MSGPDFVRVVDLIAQGFEQVRKRDDRRVLLEIAELVSASGSEVGVLELGVESIAECLPVVSEFGFGAILNR